MNALLFFAHGLVDVELHIVDAAGGLGGMVARTLAEYDGVQQGVGPQPVAAVDADAGALAGRVHARQVGLSVDVGAYAAHGVVHAGADRNGVRDHVHADQIDADLADLAELLHDQGLAQVAAVQVDTAVHAVSGINLSLFSPGDHVAGGQLHHVGSVFFQKSIAVFIQKVGAFTSGRFGDQDSAAGQSGGVVLDHLHVHQLGPGVVGQCRAVTGADQGVGAGLEHPAEAAGAEYDRLSPDGVDLAGSYLQGHNAADLAVFDYQGADEPLFVAPDPRLDELLEHHVEQGLAGEVADEEGPGAALAAEGPGAQFAFVVAVEGDAEVFHVDQGLTRRLAHDLDCVLVAQVIAAFHRVVGMFFPIIAAVCEGGVDASLGRVGVAAHRVHLADDCCVGAACPGRDGRPHSRQACADYQDIMLEHACLFPPNFSFKF